MPRSEDQAKYDGPPLDPEITGKELDRNIAQQLRGLPEKLAARVARHLVAAGQLIEEITGLSTRPSQVPPRPSHTVYEYDDMGNVTKMIEAAGSIFARQTEMEYDDNGNLTRRETFQPRVNFGDPSLKPASTNPGAEAHPAPLPYVDAGALFRTRRLARAAVLLGATLVALLPLGEVQAQGRFVVEPGFAEGRADWLAVDGDLVAYGSGDLVALVRRWIEGHRAGA